MGLSDKLIDSAGNPLPVSVEVARLCQVVAGYEMALKYCDVAESGYLRKKFEDASDALTTALEAEAAAPDLQSKGGAKANPPDATARTAKGGMMEMSAKEVIRNLRGFYFFEKDYEMLTEFRPSIGWSGEARRIDAWFLHRTTAKGMQAHSVEVKVSRGDWLNEIKQPTKARLAMAFSNYMWLATLPGIAKPEEMPPQWGLLEINPLCLNTYDRVTVKLQAEYRDKIRPTWALVASAIRASKKDLP